MSLGLKQNIVELVDHDVKWKIFANQTIQLLWKIFGSTAKDIQHIGSTSIPNIKAKPIIDIAISVEDFKRFEPLIPALEKNGFSYRGWFLVERIMVLNVYKETEASGKIITHHVHVVKADSKEWNDHINFRDYLNAHPSVASEYEVIKTELASIHPYDEERIKYNEGKNDIICKILNNAIAWRLSGS